MRASPTAAEAPGAPGIAPTWTTSAKDAVTTALGPSRLWATLGYGIVNEVYWPSTGRPQVRDLGFIVAGPDGWHEVKRERDYEITTPRPAIPLPAVTHLGEGYRLRIEVLPDPARDVLLVRYALEGEAVRLYVLLAPHLEGSGHHNDARAGDDLAAIKDGAALSLQCSRGFSRASAGYVGFSDGWQDFARNGRMTWTYGAATDGNVALMGELAENDGTLALGLATTIEGARTLAASSLAGGYAAARARFVAGWEDWAATLKLPEAPADIARVAEVSAAVLKVHEDRTYPGAVVASLSVPWGNTRDDPGGYHLVWTRDAAEAGLALLAVGQTEGACAMLSYFAATQAPDGSWTQNHYPDGHPYWTGIQLDEIGFPILLAAKLTDLGAVCDQPLIESMISRAAGYIARTGPYSAQDRWEENPGASPFTLAVAITALLVAAEHADDAAERDYLRSLADCWNERVEEWTYVLDGPLGRTHGVPGYYVRIGPPRTGLCGRVEIKNRSGESVDAAALVGMEFLYLVRMGLRRPDDPRIRDTLKVVDALLRVETPSGPAYHRYNGDGYGEHADGSAFDGAGIGRAWPLLAGERGHYEVQSGGDALPYLRAMARMSSPGGMLPEQVWDTDPIPARALAPGRPSGSAMPLVWAHAELLSLLLAARSGRPVELLDCVAERYGAGTPAAATWHWRHDSAFAALPAGRDILIEDAAPFMLHYGFDGWQRTADRRSAPTAFGMHGVRLRADALAGAHSLDLTFYRPQTRRWEGRNYGIALAPQPVPVPAV